MYRYINPGRIALFKNTPGSNWRETTNSAYTKTGVGFACDTTMMLPDIPIGTKDMWAKLDYYSGRNDNYTRLLFRFNSTSTYCGAGGGNNTWLYVNGSGKQQIQTVSHIINQFWFHIKSGTNDGVFEMYLNGAKVYEFTGNVLNGADIANITLASSNDLLYTLSNIIVSDSAISLTEQVVTIPCNITTDMKQNQDGSYSATAVDQYLEYGIDTSVFDSGTVFTGVNIAARNCIRDGEGINELEFLEGNTTLDTQAIPTAENCGISHGITLNDESPANFALHNYKLKAK